MKMTRVVIQFPASELERLDAEANRFGLSRAAYIRARLAKFPVLLQPDTSESANPALYSVLRTVYERNESGPPFVLPASNQRQR